VCGFILFFRIHGGLLSKKPRCDSHGLSKTFVESTSGGSDVDTGWMGLGNVPFPGDDLKPIAIKFDGYGSQLGSGRFSLNSHCKSRLNVLW
jgi:hypothetical protein